MSKYFLLVILVLVSFAAGFVVRGKALNKNKLFVLQPKDNDKSLGKYTIENLSKAEINPGKFSFGEMLGQEDKFTSYFFEFEFNPNLDGKTFKKTTGQINIPKGAGPFPLIIMLRGYINQESFKTGDGTRNAAAFFAKNGFLTLAPDFLGYGGSDKEADNIFESRFQTYVTALSLLKYIKNNSVLETENGKWKIDKLFIWGHSNGGQIALTVLEITGAEYPTTLWAPVSKAFPYSILYYTDDSEDRGKLIRRELAIFEENYNPDMFSSDLYLEKIKAPLQIHQGDLDDAVPANWSDELVNKLKKEGKTVYYYHYPEGDHNMRPTELVWNIAVNRDLEFFKNKSNSL